ncbi:MAG: hypothetical protein D6820_04405, partial [Lentisphaerae bacterium]
MSVCSRSPSHTRRSPSRRRCMRKMTVWALVLFLAGSGCRRRSEDDSRLSWQIIGGPGHSSGLFNRPRGIDFSARRQRLYVVDWDGRIQCFSVAGNFRGGWVMPDIDKGKPEDLCITPEGTILVADTHYSRVVEFDSRGRVLRMFGSYGMKAGQFVYPVGICQDRQGNIYVSEYGGIHSIQKFTREGKFLLRIGRTGSKPGELQRPSGICIGPDGALYVADAVNHRIQSFDCDTGKPLGAWGRLGSEPGAFRYPYDVDFWHENMVVLEYG